MAEAKRKKSFFQKELETRREWWEGLPTVRKVVPALGIFGLWFISFFCNLFKAEYIGYGGLYLFLAYFSHRTAALTTFITPVLLMGIMYDQMRIFLPLFRGYIRVQWPYYFELEWFGIETEKGRQTPNEYLQDHTHPVLDLICGLFYLLFIILFLACTAFHGLVLPLIAKDKEQIVKISRLAPYSTWAFFFLNLIGYSTYFWFPAAPPWYVVEYGLDEPAKMDAKPLAGGCTRFDELVGAPIFHSIYSKSANIFGAIPSLHISYPLLALCFAFSLKSLRHFTVVFYLVMCFAAVYLNHHYIIDIIWGSAYVLFVFGIIDRLSKIGFDDYKGACNLAILTGNFREYRRLLKTGRDTYLNQEAAPLNGKASSSKKSTAKVSAIQHGMTSPSTVNIAPPISSSRNKSPTKKALESLETAESNSTPTSSSSEGDVSPPPVSVNLKNRAKAAN